MRRLLLCALLLLACSGRAWAGPPFITNDPDPPDPGQFELIFDVTNSQLNLGRAQSGELGGVEVNYGADARTQLTLSLPCGFERVPGHQFGWGFGDMVLEYKHRFGEDPDKGYFGVNPQITVPTGRGLGETRFTADAPLLYQRQFGKTVVYTDLRYRWHGSSDGSSYLFWGAACEHEMSARWTLGGEVYATTRNQLFPGAPVEANEGYNLGLRRKLNRNSSFIMAAGNTLHGRPVVTLFTGVVVLTTPTRPGEKSDRPAAEQK